MTCAGVGNWVFEPIAIVVVFVSVEAAISTVAVLLQLTAVSYLSWQARV